MRATPETRTGILQPIGANPGWEYEISVRYWIVPLSTGVVRLGVDPNGGIDPTSKSIRWGVGRSSNDWASVAVRAIANAYQITIFIEAFGRDIPLDPDDVSAPETDPATGRLRAEPIVAYLDRVRLVAVQHINPKDKDFDLGAETPVAAPSRPNASGAP